MDQHLGVEQRRQSIYLHPGKVFVSSKPCDVTTILGSCVAVCLWDPVLGTGGINHYLLPYWTGEGESSARFGNVAIELLIRGLLSLGNERPRLQAKIFGGACVLDAMRNAKGHLGSKNVEVARKFLGEAGIPVVGGDVGGCQGRKLIFRVDDGTAWVRLL